MQDKDGKKAAVGPFMDLGEDRPLPTGVRPAGKSARDSAATARHVAETGASTVREDARSSATGITKTRRDGGMSYALMLGVFVLSAMAGGGLAALWLAMQQEDAPRAAANPGMSIAMPAPTVGDNAVVARNGASGASRNVASRPTARTSTVSEPSTVGTTELTKRGGDADASADGQVEELIKTLDRARRTSVKPPAATGARTSAEPPGTKVADAGAGASELRQLTEQVVAALGAMQTMAEEGPVEATETGAERLRATLADLVGAALARGKSQAEIGAIVAEALESAGEENIPAILRDATGRVDVGRLLASVMASMDAAEVPMDSGERAYFNQLREEAVDTAGAARTGGVKRRDDDLPKPKGRFFRQNGKIYTIVRRGDTLGEIAYAAYGDMLAYPLILRANRGRISARKLKPGTRIVIPRLKTRQRARLRKKARQGRTRRATGARTRKAADARTGGDKTPPAKNAPRAEPVKDASRIITLPASASVSPPEERERRVRPVKTMNFTSARKAAAGPPDKKQKSVLPVLTGTASTPAR